MSKHKITSFIEEMMELLTFRHAGLLFVLAIMVVALFSLYEYREKVISSVFSVNTPAQQVEWELSDASKRALDGLPKSTGGLIGAVILTDADLKKNRKKTRYIHIADQQVASVALPIAEKILPQALFNFDANNTKQMVAMLSNEFLCVPSADTVNAKFFPDKVKDYPVTCRLAVPPFIGTFVGYITVLLTREPTAAEMAAVKLELNRVSVELYLRDIAKK